MECSCLSGSSSSQGCMPMLPPTPAVRQCVALTIDQPEQLPAAEAVIAAMYGVANAINSLEHQQQVHAVLIADMVGAPAAAEEAVGALKAAAESEHGLSAAALAALAGLRAWPACLLQLLPVVVQHAPCCSDDAADLAELRAADSNGRVQRLLLAVPGDLDAVWADKQLKELLLGLPLPAMQLLLSADRLRVAAEDTVLFTASCYAYEQDDEARTAAEAALAPLVRVPQLSRFALACVAHSVEESEHLLHAHAAQVMSVVSLLRLASPKNA